MQIKHVGTAMPWRPVVTAVALSLLLAASARANIVSPVTLNLIAPGGVTDGTVGGTNTTPISASASVDPATGLHAGDAGSLISSFWMLPGEFITFSGDSILLHVGAGAALGNGDLKTGYLGSGGQHARYVFDNLAVAGKTLVGANILDLAGVISGTGGGFTGPGQVSFNLDDLKFINPGTGTSNAFGDFRIDLVLQDIVTPPPGGGTVPEPASWALALIALAALRGAARGSRA